MLGVGEQGVAGAVLDDLAVAHDGDAAGDFSYYGEIVGDEEHGELVLALELGEQGEDLGLNGDVEGGGGLVCNEQAGAVDESHGDEDALALAAGELVGIVGVAARGVGDGDGFKRGDGLGATFAAGGGGGMGRVGLGDLMADGHDGVECGHGLLKDDGDGAATETAEGCGRLAEQVDWTVGGVEEDLAFGGGCGVEQAGDGEGGGAFSGAGFADEAEDFTLLKREGDAADGVGLAEADV